MAGLIQSSPRRGEASESRLSVICLSLEAWDEVWRRNQFLVTKLLSLNPSLDMLFVEPASDIFWSLVHRRPLRPARLRPIGGTGRLWAVAPRKWLPRRVWRGVDRSLARQVRRAAERLGMRNPIAWINDSGYSDLLTDPAIAGTVYDVTDDWVLGATSQREAKRQRHNDQLMIQHACQVVVCSPDLARTRGATRPVHLIPNGVDTDYLRGPRPRPRDLPGGRVALYTGTLSAGRLDLGLCEELARGISGSAHLVFVGPNSLSQAETNALRSSGAVILGSRPYFEMPGYLQHADVLVVPHLVTPFTESLDPIKAREFVAVGRPTISTPVAGFRDLGGSIALAEGPNFVERVREMLAAPPMPPGPGPLTQIPGSWDARAEMFLRVLESARQSD